MPGKKSKRKPKCKSQSHDEHLCYFVAQGFHLSDSREYNSLINKPKFKCRHCGRAANKDRYLCEPVSL
jgi:hypothetical protein